MTGDQRNVAGLTKALVVGAALGTMPIVLVGCAPSQGSEGATATPSASEQQLCDRALNSQDPKDVEDLLRSYPRASCIPALLSTLPPQKLSQISPSVLGDMPQSVRRRIPRETRVFLFFPSDDGPSGSGPGGGGRGAGGGDPS